MTKEDSSMIIELLQLIRQQEIHTAAIISSALKIMEDGMEGDQN